MHRKSQQPNAGSAEPSWYEWLHGLVHVVELLDPDSPTKAVAFQLTGVKGWDDVGVRYEDGTIELMQMKHSRAGDRLTFSDLVSCDQGGKSLLGSLAEAWSKISSNQPYLKCVLVTNRTPGIKWHLHRPPLQAFLDALRSKLEGARTAADVLWSAEDQAMEPAWAELLDQLQVIQGNELDFLRILEIRTAGEDLPELAARLDQRITALTGLPASSISELRNALVGQLHVWTCHTQRPSEWIDGDELRKLLADEESPPRWIGHCDVETPEPFFASREAVIQEISKALSTVEGPSHYFLSAEPGSGKTSCISKLVRDAPLRWQDQVVSLRYYAFRPIVPGRADTGSDSDFGATPDALWLGLLWQLRHFLRRTTLLKETHAPVWLHGLTWSQARDHVLRIASLISVKWQRPFVIAVDGIDHAARAKRKKMSEFLRSLPGPDAIPPGIRLMVAGQPVDAYPEYPAWLRTSHPSVCKFSLGELQDEDIKMLWRARTQALPDWALPAVVQMLVTHGMRRTLPTVYAVEDISTARTISEAEVILRSRRLSDSLHEYYDDIWTSAVGGDRSPLEPSLAAAFVLLRERPTAKMLNLAFPEWNKSIAEWEQHLRQLRPLIRETSSGYEPVHNDLRVYLDGRLAGDPESRKQAALRLAAYYRSPQSDRLFAHRTLLALLREADREEEFADVFDTKWVIESGVVDIVGDELGDQCHAAFGAACRRKDWLLLHRVACASLTVNKLQECVKQAGALTSAVEDQALPFMPKEGDTLAVELWSRADIEEVIDTANHLESQGHGARARTILQQWFGDRSVAEIGRLTQTTAPDSQRVLGEPSHYDPSALMNKWGRLACRLDLVPRSGDDVDDVLDEPQRASVVAFEEGWATEWGKIENRMTALRRWIEVRPRYLKSWAAAIRGAANYERWGEARGLMKRLEENVDDVSNEDRLDFAWIALRSRLPEDSRWIALASKSKFGWSDSIELPTAIEMAQIVGYRELLREPGQVAEDLADMLDRRQYRPRHLSSSRLFLRGAMVLGRLWRFVDQKDSTVATRVPIRDLQPLLDALWLKHPDWRTLNHNDMNLGPQIGAELAALMWRSNAYDEQHQLSMAREVFNSFWGTKPGLQAFEMLLNGGEEDWLREAVGNLVEEAISTLHADSYANRVETVSTLIRFSKQLNDSSSVGKLESCARRTRIGYSGHNEWVFRPLSSWLEFLVERNPSEWKASGLRMLRLDKLCNSQDGESGFSDELISVLGAGAIMAGSQHLAHLWGMLENHNKRWGNLWVLTKAVRDGFVHVLKSAHPLSGEAVGSLTALAVGLGRWPKDSTVEVIDDLQSELPPDHPQQNVLDRMRAVAADFYTHCIVKELSEQKSQISRCPDSEAPTSTSNEILQASQGDSFDRRLRLATIAELGHALHYEKRSDRALIMSEALERLSRGDALDRCLDGHEHQMMSAICRYLTDDEQWKLMEVVTAVTGPLRKHLPDDSWVYTVAFNAVDLLCQVRAKIKGSHELGQRAAEQLLQTHEAWAAHPSFEVAPEQAISNVPLGWPDTVRDLLLRLLESDACETVYSAMSGLRLFVELYPHQIPSIVRQSRSSWRKREVLLSLGEIWSCRYPDQMKKVLNELVENLEEYRLDEQVQAWIARSLVQVAQDNVVQPLVVPSVEQKPTLAFPGDSGLLADTPHVDGLERYNSFASITAERFERLGHVLGSLEEAQRLLAGKFRSGALVIPDFRMKAPSFLASDGMTPRSKHEGDLEFGRAVIQQFSGTAWSPGVAGAVRSALGGGMDPWIATTPPVIWQDKDRWPSYSDIERWAESGFRREDEVALQLEELVSGYDLTDDEIVLGSVLECPTYRRDFKIWFWLETPQRSSLAQPKGAPTTMSSKTFASFFGGWNRSRAEFEPDTSVHFSGALITFPNIDLEVTPTNGWLYSWQWSPVVRNPLRWLAQDGTPAARYEQWLQDDGYTGSHRLSRQSMLRRWVAKKSAIPSGLDGLVTWRRRSEKFNGPLRESE
jgi:hypothetical protein